jgi:hypothetical protein
MGRFKMQAATRSGRAPHAVCHFDRRVREIGFHGECYTTRIGVSRPMKIERGDRRGN